MNLAAIDGSILTFDYWLPLLLLLSSLLPGLLIFALREEQHTLRTVLNLAGAGTKLVLVGLMLWGVYYEHRYVCTIPFLPELPLTLRADPLPMLFVTLSAVLWLVTTIYAIGYLEHSPNRSRFFGYFSLCVSSTVGIAMAGDLLTFLIFYEVLTLTTYPLVVHRGNPAALKAGRKYLAYTLSGSALLLLAVGWLYALAGTLTFTERGFLADLRPTEPMSLVAIFALLIVGFGVKAALVPLHGWLPSAMVAPAPVSALLHAVAVVKAGAFGIVRVVTDVYGIEFSETLGLLTPLAVAAAATIVYGSLRALTQDDLKKRLAYSTVSQVSYIALGMAIASPVSTVGGIAHLVHQGLMKITLFFCAGLLAETLGIHRVSQMTGTGRRMPWTMAAFTIGALGMIGVPPMAGFISKWHLGVGAVQAGETWVVFVLIASTLLNAAYFLPIVFRAWFIAPPEAWPKSAAAAQHGEAKAALLWPAVFTAGLALAAGLMANAPFSPLGWAKLIAAREWSLEPVASMVVAVAAETTSTVPAVLWWLTVAVPLLLGLALLFDRLATVADKLACWGAVPALVLAVMADPDSSTSVSWLLLGTVWGVDELSRAFLFFTALLWLIGGIYARGYFHDFATRRRFFVGFLLAMAGNLALVLARDMASFYAGFALMGFASYGLVVFNGDAAAFRAGRVYLVLTLLGEAMVFSALVWLVAKAQSTLGTELALVAAQPDTPTWIIALVIFGLGVKAGALPLHFWLPLAHPAAPAPASAVLSGAMIKAGLVGWMGLLPIGLVALPGWGAWCVVAGIAAAFYAVAIGLLQRNPKTVLAYSSISQMGLMLVGIGVGLASPKAAGVALAAVAVYAMHHGLAKGTLFLAAGIGAKQRLGVIGYGLLVACLVVPAAALAGFPLTSGALAKTALKSALDYSDIAPATTIQVLLAASAVGTTALMVRLLWVSWPRWPGPDARTTAQSPRSAWITHLALTAGMLSVLVATWLWPWDDAPHVSKVFSPEALLAAIWPIAIGLAVSWMVARWARARRAGADETVAGSNAPWVPPGDLLALAGPLGRVLAAMAEPLRGWLARLPASTTTTALPDAFQTTRRIVMSEHLLQNGTTIGIGLLAALLAAAGLVLLG